MIGSAILHSFNGDFRVALRAAEAISGLVVPHPVDCTPERLGVADHLEMREAVDRLELDRLALALTYWRRTGVAQMLLDRIAQRTGSTSARASHYSREHTS